MKSYTLEETAKITGLTPRQIKFLTEKKVMDPEIQSGKGRGRKRLYSRANLRHILILHELRSMGITFTSIPMVTDFRQDFNKLLLQKEDYRGTFLILQRKTRDHPYFGTGTREAPSEYDVILAHGQLKDYTTAIVINLERLFAPLKAV